MGLLYPFPTSLNESDHAILKKYPGNFELRLKTYGLPYVFWFYLLGALLVWGGLFLASHDLLEKMINSNDLLNQTLGEVVYWTMWLVPLGGLVFYFYEKVLVRTRDYIEIVYKVFFLTIFKRKISLASNDRFEVVKFLESGNMARRNPSEGNRGFQNQGYFILKLVRENKSKIELDRHSQRNVLEGLRKLLEKIHC